MSAAAPRRGAAIALSFAVQGVLIAGSVALSGDLSSRGSASAAPVHVELRPIASPPDNFYNPEPIPATVKVGNVGFTEQYPAPGVQSLFLLSSGPEVTVTVSLLASDSSPGLSFALCDPPLPPGSVPPKPPPCRVLLNVPDVRGQGTLAFTLHAGSLTPGSDKVIDMTESRPYDPNMQSSEIAEIVIR